MLLDVIGSFHFAADDVDVFYLIETSPSFVSLVNS